MTLRRIAAWMAGTAGWMVAATTGLTLSQPAHGQLGQAAGITNAMVPDYVRRDLVIFEEELDLDQTQRAILEAMFDDYMAEFDAGMERLRQKYEDLRPQLDPQDEQRVLRMIFAPFEERIAEKAQLRDEFIANVKVMLTAEQLEIWPKFERKLFREKQLPAPNSMLSGEGVDLIRIVQGLRLNEQDMATIAPTLEQYELALDAALHARLNAIDGSISQMLQGMAEQNAELSLGVLERQLAFRTAVRSVNDQYITEIGNLLPPDKAREFRKRALAEAYPRVYRDTPVDRMFEQAMELDGLSGETLASISALHAAYTVEIEPLNEELADLIRFTEPKEELRRTEMFYQQAKSGGGTMAKQHDPTRPRFEARDNLGRQYVRQLASLLTEEQLAQIPGSARWLADPETERPTTNISKEDHRNKVGPTKTLNSPPSRQRGGGDIGSSRGEAPPPSRR